MLTRVVFLAIRRHRRLHLYLSTKTCLSNMRPCSRIDHMLRIHPFD